MKRRTFLLGAGAFTGMGIVTASERWQSKQTSVLAIPATRNFTVSGKETLRQRAATKGLLYGAALQSKQLETDSAFSRAIAQECNIIVPEFELKWRTVRPSPSVYHFAPADKLLSFAHAHNMKMRGHTLVWHEDLPSWVDSALNSLNAKQILTDHISTVVKHYAGKMHSWDVVNEAIEPKDGRSDGLRNSPWLTMLGPEYIDLAFRVAAESDPKAVLTYNDFGMDYDTPFGRKKRMLVLNLLRQLKANGTPIHALGIQAHLHRDNPNFNPDSFSTFLQEVADLGLKIMITELDLTEKKLPTDTTLRDRTIAAAYEDYLTVALSQPAVIAVLTWGLSDRYTWLSTAEPRTDGAPVRPLPLDAQMKRKLAWNAIARSLDKTTQRSMIP
jgi:endo-1,4-beta-xylanase